MVAFKAPEKETLTKEFRTQFGEKRTYLDYVKDLSWVGGFFDGEGCIYYKELAVKNTVNGKQYSYPEVQVIVAQSGEEGKTLLEMFQVEYGFGKITSNHGSKLTKKTPYMTRMSGKKALLFLKKIEPYLLLKQDKARLVINEQWEHFFD